jgi:hypothetical protein
LSNSADGFDLAACLDGALTAATWSDTRSEPPIGDGYYYLIQARKPCASGGYGEGRAILDALACASP